MILTFSLYTRGAHPGVNISEYVKILAYTTQPIFFLSFLSCFSEGTDETIKL